jgi:hypothetical protein
LLFLDLICTIVTRSASSSTKAACPVREILIKTRNSTPFTSASTARTAIPCQVAHRLLNVMRAVAELVSMKSPSRRDLTADGLSWQNGTVIRGRHSNRAAHLIS